MAAPVVSMVLNQLGTFLREEIHKKVIMVFGVKEEIKKLELTLTAIQAVLHDADKKQVQDQRVKVWLERLKEVVYEIEDILDNWNTKIIQSKIRNQNSPGIRAKLDSIDRDKNKYGLASGMLTEGRIEISGLRRVKSVNEAKEVHLANKRGIHALALDFGSNVITEGDEERMEANGFKSLPSLGRLPLLEVLEIGGMKSVRRLGLDFLGISDIEDATTSIGRGQLIAFPSLI
ncbi:hypothetical protein GIB67_027901 [Kingdonia uniflora]|uniref:Disease resistance N-terminal domain-containing protein n=1 Tax=Kingdonia uniflora TaxID=39325 RepID=A0A7J7LGH3_9MAGN|nr:hypothetical protein GIB67_027901 [Kingdonia uniflora]